MRKELTVNRRVYKPVEMTFNAICDMEDMGVTLEGLGTGRMFGALRAYLALCMGDTDTHRAGAEIEAHIMDGGDLNELTACMMEAFEESGFFRALQTTAEDTAAQDQPKTEKA